MFAVRVETPDERSAHDLEAHLASRMRQSLGVSTDGAVCVIVDAAGVFPEFLSVIREWMQAERVNLVVVEVSGTRYTMES